MTDEKRKRLYTAITINAVILIVFLIIVIVYQVINIVVLSNRKKEIQEQITQTEQIKSQQEDKLSEYLSDDYLQYKAYEYGYVFEGED